MFTVLPCSELQCSLQSRQQAFRAKCPKIHIVLWYIEVLGLFSMSKYCRNHHMHKLQSLFGIVQYKAWNILVIFQAFAFTLRLKCIKGRSLTMMTKFCPLLTTYHSGISSPIFKFGGCWDHLVSGWFPLCYLPLVDISEGISFLLYTANVLSVESTDEAVILTDKNL